MPKKAEPAQLEDILRGRGARQGSVVKPNVTEIRSCGVMGHNEDDDKDKDKDKDDEHGRNRGKASEKGRPSKSAGAGPRKCPVGLLIIWEFSVEYDRVEAFHQFLEKAEPKIAASIAGLDPTAQYQGTFILHAGGTPRYRTLWGYRSQSAMVEVWKKAMKSKGDLVALTKGLREHWLRDPHRSEARWICAQQASFSEADAPFAKLTIDTFKERIRGK